MYERQIVVDYLSIVNPLLWILTAAQDDGINGARGINYTSSYDKASSAVLTESLIYRKFSALVLTTSGRQFLSKNHRTERPRCDYQMKLIAGIHNAAL